MTPGCPYSEHNICKIATRLANVVVPLNPAACDRCLNDAVPMSVNRVTASIAAKAQKMAGLPVERDLLRLATGRHDLAGYVLERYIHKWLNRFGIRPPVDCGCDHWVAKMNAWGIDGSIEHLDEITAQVAESLRQTYLGTLALPWLTEVLIKNRIRACLLRRRS